MKEYYLKLMNIATDRLNNFRNKGFEEVSSKEVNREILKLCNCRCVISISHGKSINFKETEKMIREEFQVPDSIPIINIIKERGEGWNREERLERWYNACYKKIEQYQQLKQAMEETLSSTIKLTPLNLELIYSYVDDLARLMIHLEFWYRCLDTDRPDKVMWVVFYEEHKEIFLNEIFEKYDIIPFSLKKDSLSEAISSNFYLPKPKHYLSEKQFYKSIKRFSLIAITFTIIFLILAFSLLNVFYK